MPLGGGNIGKIKLQLDNMASIGATHAHLNKTVIDELSDNAGVLQYKGQSIQGGVGEPLVCYTNLVTPIAGATNVLIGIEEYVNGDILDVYMDNVLLYPTNDYTLNANGTSIDLVEFSVNGSNVFMFKVTKGEVVGSGDGHTHGNKIILDNITAAYTIGEQNKLGGIESGANAYTHPSTHSADIITDGTNNKVLTSALKTSYDSAVTSIGTLSSLSTTNKSDLVSALNEVFQDVSNGKSLIATAITDKGVTTSSSDTFSTMATNITSISSGSGSESTDVNGWIRPSQWQNISNPASNTISMLFSDLTLKNAFTVTTTSSVDYTVTVTGITGDTTTTCIINGSTVNFGTSVSMASGTQCDITFTTGSGQTTDYGYTTFKVDITSVNTLLTCKMKKHTNDNVVTYSSLLWCVVNANINDTANMFYNTNVYCRALRSCSITSTALTTLGTYTFYNCSSLKSAILPNSITSYGLGAFQNCVGLERFAMSNTVTSLNNSTFSGCSALSTINLSNTLASVNYGQFESCSSLRKITIPSSVTSLASYFKNCSSLETIDIQTSASITNADWDGSNTYNLSALNAPNIVFTRLLLQCSSGNIGKLHNITFSASSTFSYATAPQIDISYTSFSANELNSLFTALPTVTSKTIKVTGCLGAGTCDTSIATAKGWTVTIA